MRFEQGGARVDALAKSKVEFGDLAIEVVDVKTNISDSPFTQLGELSFVEPLTLLANLEGQSYSHSGKLGSLSLKLSQVALKTAETTQQGLVLGLSAHIHSDARVRPPKKPRP
jgi:hypothetical protein